MLERTCRVVCLRSLSDAQDAPSSSESLVQLMQTDLRIRRVNLSIVIGGRLKPVQIAFRSHGGLLYVW